MAGTSGTANSYGVPPTRIPIIEGSPFTASAATSSSTSESTFARHLLLADNDIQGTATLQLLFNIATGQPPLFNILGREHEWL